MLAKAQHHGEGKCRDGCTGVIVGRIDEGRPAKGEIGIARREARRLLRIILIMWRFSLCKILRERSVRIAAWSLEKQLYGLASSDIIYHFAMNYIFSLMWITE